ncbi:50S ribosomal protein L31 [Alphaproteobacteria bacterium endosymbiont of Tiliacea citrago]|uniref:50S ribosomal protein L31 n=1 Tax=Alphaproteobacteria bacterium endosymbiont of Tiliacea citrago TaxID=3077944 RepID=UPI00313D3B1D
MKKGIHPNFQITNIYKVNKEIVQLITCLPDNFHLSMDPSNHPAWTKSSKNSGSVGKAAEFAKKYKGIEEL